MCIFCNNPQSHWLFVKTDANFRVDLHSVGYLSTCEHAEVEFEVKAAFELSSASQSCWLGCRLLVLFCPAPFTTSQICLVSSGRGPDPLIENHEANLPNSIESSCNKLHHEVFFYSYLSRT